MAIRAGKGGEMQIVLRVKDDGTAVIEKFGKTAEREGEKASESWNKIGKAVGLAAAAAATTAAVMVKSAIDTADATGKAADKLGMTTESFSALAYAAKTTADITRDNFGQAMRMMVDNLSQAAQGTGLAKNAIADLGLNARQLTEMGPEKAIMAISDAMEKIPNQGDRVRIAMDVFRNSDMVNALRGGSAAMREMMDEAKRFGQVVGRDTANQADAFNDNIDRLKAAAGGMANTMAAQMLPALIGITDAMVDTAKNSGFLEATAKTLGVTLQGLTTIGLGVANAFQQTGTWIGAGAAAAVAASQGEFSQAREIVRMAAEDIEKMNAEAAASIAKVWSGEAPANGDAEKPSSGGGASSRSQLAREETAKLKEELAKQLVAIHEATTSEEQLLGEKYVKDLQALEQALSLKLLSQEDYEAQRQAVIDTYEQKANEKHANELIRMAESMEALSESLMTEQELLTNAYLEKQILLDEALMNNLISEQTYYENLWLLKAQHDQKMADANARSASAFEKQETSTRDRNTATWESGGRGKLEIAARVAGQFASLMQSSSKKEFEIGKKAAISSALISTYLAVTNALATQPFILGVALAAGALVSGMMQVKNIQKQQFGGGGIAATPTFSANPNTGLPEPIMASSPTSSLPPPPASSAAAPARVTYMTIVSDSGLVGLEWIRTSFAPAFEQAQRDGGIVILR